MGVLCAVRGTAFYHLLDEGGDRGDDGGADGGLQDGGIGLAGADVGASFEDQDAARGVGRKDEFAAVVGGDAGLACVELAVAVRVDVDGSAFDVAVDCLALHLAVAKEE